MGQFEILRLATRSTETGIYIRAIASRSREIAPDIPATGIYILGITADSRETGIYWLEIATYSREIAADIQEVAANIEETGIYTRRPAGLSGGMATNSPILTASIKKSMRYAYSLSLQLFFLATARQRKRAPESANDFTDSGGMLSKLATKLTCDTPSGRGDETFGI